MVDDLALFDKILQIKTLIDSLRACSSQEKKVDFLKNNFSVLDFFKKFPIIKDVVGARSLEDQFVFESLLALGQGEAVFCQPVKDQEFLRLLDQLLDILRSTERFYDQVGGLLGYHYTVLKLLEEKNGISLHTNSTVAYSQPPISDFSEKTALVNEAILCGIENLDKMGELFTVGGAGDRLNLIDPQEKIQLPVASLIFAGRTLLDGLIRDVQAREYLYYKLTGKQITIPIALMTSVEKYNHGLILKMMKSANWFNRGEDNFRFFTQPLVPVISEGGDWVVEQPLKLQVRPGGHGVLWKLAKDQGILSWFLERGCDNVLIRQVNNPIAGFDYNLLSFVGNGILKGKTFGFASCPRLLKTAEGMLVQKEERTEAGIKYGITNIEYTEFKKNGLDDKPKDIGSPYSVFPANTNILMFNLHKIASYIEKNPFPGLLLNMKKNFETLTKEGEVVKVLADRLESTMQNIADVIVTSQSKDLDTYITYFDRKKTISVCKKAFENINDSMETPYRCFYDLQQNYYDFLETHCYIEMPAQDSFETFVEKSPTYLIDFHPSMGPLYEVMSQKIHHGTFSSGSELKLEITELEIDNLKLKGSLVVVAESLMGSLNTEGMLEYSENTGQCVLKNVIVSNKGIDWSNYKINSNDIPRAESLTIQLLGNSAFYAENIVFNGNYSIVVPDGVKMTAEMQADRIVFKSEKVISKSIWAYEFDADNKIILSKRA